MNTRQKLTLGIAAIFMVTLTIVGVTYAYFVTRVTGATDEDVTVQTAEIGSVVYGDGNSEIVLTNVMPGAVAYKTFTITNSGGANSSALPYSLYYTSNTLASTPEFVHQDTDTACYPSTTNVASGIYNSLGTSIAVQTSGNNAGQYATGHAPSTCFSGSTYNNVVYTLYEYTGSSTLQQLNTALNGISESDFASLTGKTVVGTANTNVAAVAHVVNASGVDETNAFGTVITTAKQNFAGATNLSVAGAQTRTYILRVEYQNNGSNQNIENLAGVNIKVNVEI